MVNQFKKPIIVNDIACVLGHPLFDGHLSSNHFIYKERVDMKPLDMELFLSKCRGLCAYFDLNENKDKQKDREREFYRELKFKNPAVVMRVFDYFHSNPLLDYNKKPRFPSGPEFMAEYQRHVSLDLRAKSGQGCEHCDNGRVFYEKFIRHHSRDDIGSWHPYIGSCGYCDYPVNSHIEKIFADRETKDIRIDV